ncbi:MAG TPA: molybdopterin-dependent oxidoreductase, partial [Acidimicrobiales bacterium]
AKGIVGTDSVDAQLGDGLPADLVLSLPRATIDDACSARTVLLLTGDVREELPVLFLRLREAAIDGGVSLVELTSKPTALTPYAAVSLTTRPGDAPELARALTGPAADRGSASSPTDGPAWSSDDLDHVRQLLGTRPADGERADAVGADGGGAGGGGAGGGGAGGEGVVVVLGRPSLAEHESVVADAARVLAAALPQARFLPALRRGNVNGALDMGLAPGLLPGRVSLAAGRDWFTGAWGAVPESAGLDAAGILSSLAGDAGGGSAGGGSAGGGAAGSGGSGADGETTAGRVRALVLLGADPLGDFCDHDLVARGLAAAEFVVAVTGHASATVEEADVVLPAAVEHERPGTTTNIEGRVTRLGQKLVAPGLAWPDWMIAAELAVALGGDLGVASLGDLWNEIEALAPAYAGLTLAVLDSSGAHDGVLVPVGAGGSGRGARSVEPNDPMATPGVESVERQGAPPRVGLAVSPEVEEDRERTGSVPVGEGAGALAGTKPSALTGVPAGEAPHIPPIDSYSLRLVSSRTLYDGGIALAGSPSLAGLVPTAVARANPYDLDRLGLTTGDPVRVRSARGSLVLPADADAGVPRGVVAVDFNLPLGAAAGGSDAGSGAGAGAGAGAGGVMNAAAVLIDAADVVTDVRMESVR